MSDCRSWQLRRGVAGSCQLRGADLAGCELRDRTSQLHSPAGSCVPQLALFRSSHTTRITDSRSTADNSGRENPNNASYADSEAYCTFQGEVGRLWLASSAFEWDGMGYELQQWRLRYKPAVSTTLFSCRHPVYPTRDSHVTPY